MTRERKRAADRGDEMPHFQFHAGALNGGIETRPVAPRPHRELESHLEAYFRDKVRRAGGSVHKLVPVEAGIPDRMVLLPGGRIVLVELKIPSGKVSEIQKAWHYKASLKGVIVDIVWGREGVDRWMEAQQ